MSTKGFMLMQLRTIALEGCTTCKRNWHQVLCRSESVHVAGKLFCRCQHTFAQAYMLHRNNDVLCLHAACMLP